MNKNELIDLVGQMKDGSRDAFKELYEEYYDRLYFFVLKNVGNKEAAEDITQDTFMRSLEKIGTLENPENYVTWLHTIAYHKCTDMFRSKRRDAYFDTEEEFENAMENHSLNEPVMVPEDYATDKDRARQLKEMIDSLKPDMKSVLILYYYNDMSLADVAKTMGLTENNVKQKLFRARKKLKDKIDAMGGKGIMFAAVPMDELLHRTVSPKQAAAIAGKSGAVTSIGSGLAVSKIAGISAAAVMAVGIPMALSNMGKDKHDLKGNIQLHDSSAVVTSAYDSTASSSAESALEDIITSSLSDSSVSQTDTSSRPEETQAPDTSSAEPSAGAAGIDVTAAVNTSSQAETTADDTSSQLEEKKETQPVEMNVEKLFSMTNSQLRELSNNDFEVVLEPYSYNLIYGIRCKAFPNYVYIVETRSEDGQPDGPLEAQSRWQGNEKVVLDSEEVVGVLVQGDEPIGDGIRIGMTYSQIKEARGGRLLYYSDGFAYPWIDGKVWQLHFDLTEEQRKIANEKLSQISEETEAESSTDLPYIDLSELGIDPVCTYASIYNTYNGLSEGRYPGVFKDWAIEDY